MPQPLAAALTGLEEAHHCPEALMAACSPHHRPEVVLRAAKIAGALALPLAAVVAA